jgi:PAS domain S-box-containing protein
MATNENILNLSGLSLLSITDAGKIISADAGAGTILELNGIYNKTEEIDGKDLIIFLGIKSNQQMAEYAKMIESVSSEELTVKDLNIKTLKGNDKKIQLSLLRVFSDGQSSIKVLLKDLTLDSFNEKNLLSVNLMYRTIIGIAPIGIILVDRAGTVKEFNNYLVNMFGEKSNEKYINKNIFTFNSLKEVGFLDEISFVLNNNKPAAGEKKYITDCGKVVYFSFMLVPVPDVILEKEVNAFGIIEDISKARELMVK